MALIECPECKKELSAQANFCPHCGYPIRDVKKGNEDKQDKDTQSLNRNIADLNKLEKIKQTSFLVVFKIVLYVIVSLGLVILIITLLFTFPSHEDTTRVKISRCNADMRSIATGLEAYKIDWKCYPLSLSQLTTPSAFLTTIFYDPFNRKNYFKYIYDEKTEKCIVYSVGEDGIDDRGKNDDIVRIINEGIKEKENETKEYEVREINIFKEFHKSLHNGEKKLGKYFYDVKDQKPNKNDIHSVSNFDYVIFGLFLEDSLETELSYYIPNTSDNYFMVIIIAIKNISLKPQEIPNYLLIDERGAEYKEWDTFEFFFSYGIKYGNIIVDRSKELNPDETTSKLIIFDVPKQHGYSLRVFGERKWVSEDIPYKDINLKPIKQISLD